MYKNRNRFIHFYNVVSQNKYFIIQFETYYSALIKDIKNQKTMKTISTLSEFILLLFHLYPVASSYSFHIVFSLNVLKKTTLSILAFDLGVGIF